MAQTTHVDLSEEVISHFVVTKELHPKVRDLSEDKIQELIDAIPDEHYDLLHKLRCLR